MDKKIKLATIAMSASLLVAGCSSGDTEEQDTSTNEDVEQVESTNENLFTYNQELLNDDDLTVTLLEVEKMYDETFDTEDIEVRFEVENKQDFGVEVQARSVSMNGKMVDESTMSMSQEVAAGKRADATLSIRDWGDAEVPELEEDLEMTLRIFSWDDYDYSEEVTVKANFN